MGPRLGFDRQLAVEKTLGPRPDDHAAGAANAAANPSPGSFEHRADRDPGCSGAIERGLFDRRGGQLLACGGVSGIST